MRKGNHSKRSFKGLALVLALVLVFGAVVGGTVAWLTDKTAEVKNTFTPSNIDIDLTESADLDLDMVPGKTITKDPKVTVNAEKTDVDCYLYVKIEKSANFDTFMKYEVAEGWKELSGVTGVYWREVKVGDPVKEFPVIKGNTVTVLDTVTKEMMTENFTEPTLTFTAYAVQTLGSDSAEIAWTKVPTT